MDRYTHNANESLHAQCSQGTVESHQQSVDPELQKIEQKILRIGWTSAEVMCHPYRQAIT